MGIEGSLCSFSRSGRTILVFLFFRLGLSWVSLSLNFAPLFIHSSDSRPPRCLFIPPIFLLGPVQELVLSPVAVRAVSPRLLPIFRTFRPLPSGGLEKFFFVFGHWDLSFSGVSELGAIFLQCEVSVSSRPLFAIV